MQVTRALAIFNLFVSLSACSSIQLALNGHPSDNDRSPANVKDNEPDFLIEDCKLVSLNNSLQIVFQDTNVAGIRFSDKSFEYISKKVTYQTAVYEIQYKNGSNKERAFQFKLDDPEDKMCYLFDRKKSSITELSATEIAAIKLIPADQKDPNKGKNKENRLPERFWNECNVQALNAALQAWSMRPETSAPHLSSSSSRIHTPRSYKIIMRKSRNVLITEAGYGGNVSQEAPIGEKQLPSDMRVSIESPKAGGTCTIKNQSVD